MSLPGTVLTRLRVATAQAHEALEADLDALARLSLVDDRRQLLPRYYRMHASLDPVLAQWLGGLVNLDMAARQRTALLADDLRALGVSAPADLPVMEVSSRGEAHGLLYVLEGSSLGGRMILKGLTKDGISTEGLSFMDPYGTEAGARWRDFLVILEREGATEVEAVARGGVRGFEHARQCLAGGVG